MLNLPERAVDGLQQLSKDICDLLRRDSKQRTQVESNIIRDNYGKPLVVNNLYNYNYDTRRPIQSARFGFLTVGKIIILILVIGLTIKVLLNPKFLIDSVSLIKEFFHTI